MAALGNIVIPQLTKPPLGMRPDYGHPQMRGLVGWWLFREGGGDTVRDLSLARNDGTWTGGADWAFGQRGTVGQFDGSADYVDTGVDAVPDLGLSNQLTVSVWAKSRITQSHSPIGNYDFDISGLDRETFSIFDNNGEFWCRVVAGAGPTLYTTNGGTWTAGVWYHVVMTYDGANLRLFANGVQINSTAASGTLYDSQVDIRIGARGDRTATYNDWKYDGQISSARIYNRALSQSEILDLYLRPYTSFDRKIYIPASAAAPGAGAVSVLESQKLSRVSLVGI